MVEIEFISQKLNILHRKILRGVPMERIRAFIAINIDKPEIIRRIVGVQKEIENINAAKMKPVEPQNLHYTIRFLGNITSEQVEEIYQILQEIDFIPFQLVVKGIGAFPSIGRPRVIWVGAGEGSEHVINIYNHIEKGLKKLGFKPEGKKYIPHCTIFRVKFIKKKLLLSKKLMELTNIMLGNMEVRSVKLVRSQLTPKGPIYTTLKEIKAK